MCIRDRANTGQVPSLEKLVAVIRSREISLTLFYQQMAQCKAIYDKHAETILGNMDSVISVSYTHLDVYKRQGLNAILRSSTMSSSGGISSVRRM